MSSVFLNNLDDFIAPSQACVNPTVAAKLTPAAPSSSASSSSKPGKVTLMADYSTTDYEDYAKPVVQPDLIKSKPAASGAPSVATVSLNDCLACSGCVTSAEAVLIAEQSNQKFLSKLQAVAATHEILVVQLSPNSRASLADFLGISPVEAFLLISAALKANGVRYVVDSAAGADVYLMEARSEFLRRVQQGRSKEWVAPVVTTANSSTSINVYPSNAPPGSLPSEQTVASPSLHNPLPVFTSHCPGWVCYAEKTAPQVVPFLSTVKSAQQIIGSLMKSLLLQEVNPQAVDAVSSSTLLLSAASKALGPTAPRVFMVSVQPCFDKKLESSRRDFYHANSDTTEVDLVLSTTELWEILMGFAQEWQRSESATVFTATETAAATSDAMDVDLDRDDVPTASSGSSSLQQQREQLRTQYQYVLRYLRQMQAHRGETVEGCDAIEGLFRAGSLQATQLLSAAERNAGSGAVAEYVFRFAAEQLYGVNLWAERDLQYKAGRNADYVELDLATYLPAGSTAAPLSRPLKFARAYGFRNIQSLLMKLKRGQLDVDLIEMMACPSGCNNGGGQLKNFSQWIAPAESAAKALPETIGESKERVANVEALFHAPLSFQQPERNPLVQFLYAPARLQAPASDVAVAILHTRFHAVPKLETVAPLAAKW
eukprot:gene6371-4577_t